MRLLLDTHVLIWAIGQREQLPARVDRALADPASELFVSTVSAFEITTKYRIGKLPGAALFVDDFGRVIEGLVCTPLPITIAHAALAGNLAIPHKDPFDRLLIAQAQIEGLVLVSNESLFDRFGVRRLW